ncbi:type III-A CRISPR-associated RAMP protein Csm3 [Candidatus Kryptobacter tengchongensis]|uniref:CRISPR system Cms endoribonuclease Csm3 n=1 Tax=Kryptobacter tengchongensis TaxID=1643429 RepID=A0A916LK97_KRYT1|nr:type III-A CRISPR-associated RAMP protein Csm3 [Candidatus Kryptobacter tengchongensis]CUT03237.1 CRISPR-associated protein Csm3 [Candidatus Kryptobacter tengchongensis]
MKLVKYIVITGKINVLTGLHIGGSSDIIEIGGMDNPVLKHPLTNEPYIPGSSLKGKIRSLLELSFNKVNNNGEVHKCDDEKCPICRVFGASPDKQEEAAKRRGPTRVIFRDAFIDDEYRREMQEKGLTVYDIVEEKTENALNRITAKAVPRKLERVVPGVKFAFEVVYRVFDTGDGGETDEKLFGETIMRGMKLLELDCLGGYGSRGSGKIKFEDVEIKSYSPEELKIEVEVS